MQQHLDEQLRRRLELRQRDLEQRFMGQPKSSGLPRPTTTPRPTTVPTLRKLSPEVARSVDLDEKRRKRGIPVPPGIDSSMTLKKINDLTEEWINASSAPVKQGALGALGKIGALAHGFAEEGAAVAAPILPYISLPGQAGVPKGFSPKYRAGEGNLEMEKRARELRAEGKNPLEAAIQAYRENDLWSMELNLAPRIPLPGGRSFAPTKALAHFPTSDEYWKVPIGGKGALELALDPVNLALGAGAVGKAIGKAVTGAVGRGVGRGAGGEVARRAARGPRSPVEPDPRGFILGRVPGRHPTIEGQFTVLPETPFAPATPQLALPGPRRPLPGIERVAPAPFTNTVFHGTRVGEVSSFLDTNGNLVLRSSSNFGGKTTGVSFTPDRQVAVDYASRVVGGGGRRSQQGHIFEIDRDAIPNQLFTEAEEEIATRGVGNVIIPKGKFRVVPVSRAAQGQLAEFEAQGRTATRALSDEELGEEIFRAEFIMEVAEVEAGGEASAFFGVGRRLTPAQENVAARFGPQAVDSPLEPFLTQEIRRRVAADPSAIQSISKGFSRLTQHEQNMPAFPNNPEDMIRGIVGLERVAPVIPEGPHPMLPMRSPVRPGPTGPVRAVPGQPEAGVQAGMLGVPSRAVTPAGRGQVTQLGMDDQLKLIQAREAAERAKIGRVDPQDIRELEETLAGLELEQGALLEELADDRLNTAFKWAMGPRQTEFGETLTAKQVLNLMRAMRGEVRFKGSNDVALSQVRALYPNAVTPSGRFRPEYMLDDLVTEWGGRYQGGNVERFLRDVEAAGRQGRSVTARGVEIRLVSAELEGLQRAMAAEKSLPIIEREAAREAVEVTEAAKQLKMIEGGGTPPPRSPGTPLGSGMDTPPPRRPDIGLSDDLELPTWEHPAKGIPRKWEGARAAEGLEMEEWFFQGEGRLRRLGIKPADMNAENMRPLFEVLHGERAAEELPEGLRLIYDDVHKLVRQDEQRILAFLKAVTDEGASTYMAFDAENLAGRMMALYDYFPRLWKPPPSAGQQAGTARGRLGVTPGFARPRVDATFIEMLDAGFEPATWNPYAMAAQSHIAKVEYQETVKLVNRLQQRGLVLAKNEAPEGWRVPKVGPIFEGRPIPLAEVEGGIGWTKPLAVPNPLADFLETVFGVPVNLPFAQGIRKWSNAAKRLKLVGSLFQHFDFGARALMVAGTPTGIRHGATHRFPSLAFHLMQVSIMPGKRNTLRQALLSNKTIYKDSPITWKMLIEEGWGVQGDISLIQREFVNFLADPALAQGLGPKAIQALTKMQRFWEAGLFEGVYRETQRWALQHFIIPWVRRTRPNATPRQVAAEAAEAVNVMFSTLGNWQTVIRNPQIREVARALIFSTNESEALLRGAGRALSRPGAPRAGVFREWYGGGFLALAVIATVINMVATGGKPMPPGSYIPIRLDDPYAWLQIGGVGPSYSGRFLAPQIPFVRGRNDTPLYLDIVGQMDTAFRWAFNFPAAVASRTNVLPRALMNQAAGATFFGERLDTLPRRAVAGAIDVLAPISVTSAIGAAREAFPAMQGVVPGTEGRLGVVGQSIQAGGFNLRGEPTRDMLNRYSQEHFAIPYDDLEPFQRDDLQDDPALKEELQKRQDTGVSRAQETSKFFAALDKIDSDHQQGLEELARIYGRNIGGERIDQRFIVNTYLGLQQTAAARKEQASDDFERDEFPDPATIEDPNKRALSEWYALLDEAKVNGIFVGAQLNRLRSAFERRVTREQLEYIKRNTNRRDIPGLILRFLPDSTRRRIEASQAARRRFRGMRR